MPKVVKSPFKSRVEVVITKLPPGQRSRQLKTVGNTSQQAQGSAVVKGPRRVILIVRPPKPVEPESPSPTSPTVKRIKLIVRRPSHSTTDASICITTSPQSSTSSAASTSTTSATIHTAPTTAPPPPEEEETPAPKATAIMAVPTLAPQPSQSISEYEDNFGSEPEFLYPDWTPPPIQPSTAWLHWALSGPSSATPAVERVEHVNNVLLSV